MTKLLIKKLKHHTPNTDIYDVTNCTCKCEIKKITYLLLPLHNKFSVFFLRGTCAEEHLFEAHEKINTFDYKFLNLILLGVNYNQSCKQFFH